MTLAVRSDADLAVQAVSEMLDLAPSPEVRREMTQAIRRFFVERERSETFARYGVHRRAP